MYDNYEDEYETDTEVEDTRGWWIAPAIIFSVYTLGVFTLGCLAWSVFA